MIRAFKPGAQYRLNDLGVGRATEVMSMDEARALRFVAIDEARLRYADIPDELDPPVANLLLYEECV